MDDQERMARARARDAVLALAGYVGALVCTCFVATTNNSWGSSTTDVILVSVLVGLAMGLAVSGLRGSRSWARALSLVVMLLALLHILEPRIILTGIAALCG